jgi:hypothetical protein
LSRKVRNLGQHRISQLQEVSEMDMVARLSFLTMFLSVSLGNRAMA